MSAIAERLIFKRFRVGAARIGLESILDYSYSGFRTTDVNFRSPSYDTNLSTN